MWCHLVHWRGLIFLIWGSCSHFGLDDHESWWRKRIGPCHRSCSQGCWWSTACFFAITLFLGNLVCSLLDYQALMQDIDKRVVCSVLTRFSLTVKLVHKIMSILLTCALRWNMTHMYLSVVAANCYFPLLSWYCAIAKKCRGSDPMREFHIPL